LLSVTLAKSEIMIGMGEFASSDHRSPHQGAAAPAAAPGPMRLWTMAEIARAPRGTDDGDTPRSECVTIAAWMKSYLMRPHAELGRAGDVCPFTAQAARLDLVRIGCSDARAGDADLILTTMQEALRAFDAIACKRNMRNFRTVLVAFPNCAQGDDVQVLKQIQNRLRHHSTVFGKMIGCFEPNSQDKGLINPDFRPLRAPIPLLAIRVLVDNDAPFVLRNPLLAPIYLMKFRLAGMRRLVAAWRA
jgi:hypothetical protein